MVLVSRTNAALGVSDKVMVLCGSALSDAVNQFKYVPFFFSRLQFYYSLSRTQHL